MKVTWEPKDVKPGLVIGISGLAEQWIIGYDPRVQGASKWCTISLADGMTAMHDSTVVQMAGELTASGYLPECLLPAK